MFHQCQRFIQGIVSRSKGASKSEQIMVRNVISSLASMVQELSQLFKKAQSKYLKRMIFFEGITSLPNYHEFARFVSSLTGFPRKLIEPFFKLFRSELAAI